MQRDRCHYELSAIKHAVEVLYQNSPAEVVFTAWRLFYFIKIKPFDKQQVSKIFHFVSVHLV